MRRCVRCGFASESDLIQCPEDGELLLESTPGKDGDPRIGTTVGGLVLVAKVADGAMGRVYKAYSADASERRAVKVLHHAIARARVNVERFRREYETAEYLDHPMVVKVHDFGQTTDGDYYMVMDFLEGSPLAERIESDGPFDLHRALRLMCQIGCAMSHAHDEGTIHRDLKPDNIFICDADDVERDETVCILDFGSVKLQMEVGERLTAIGTTLGSPSYMSPEQASGDRDLDQRTDVFAMAAIFYEMLSGRVAFGGDTMAEILNRVLYEDAAPLTEAPDALAAVILNATSKEKESRPRSAKGFVELCLSAVGAKMSMEEVANSSLADLTSQLHLEEAPNSPASSALPSPPPGGAAASVAEPAPEPMIHGASVASGGTSKWLGLGVAALVAIAIVAGVLWS